MAQILETAISFFEGNDWPFLRVEGELALQAAFRGESGEWNCYAVGSEEQQRFAFYSTCPVRVPEEKRMAMAEFITRVNYDLLIGNFELDLKDGEIRFKTSIDVEGDQLSTALVERMVVGNLAMMDTYLPGIMKVIYSDIPPAQAVDETEGAVGGNQED